jgi:hypothetical protein
MQAFSSEATWHKSKVFVERALKSRDERDFASFYLWAAVALELLAKSTLANIHPVLVADPNDFLNVLCAFGIKDPPRKKSITAATVYERLSHLSTDFDDKIKKTCMFMANFRNAELHSGETPLAGLDQRKWVPAFWKAVNVILIMQNKTLKDWVGEEEGSRVSTLLTDSSQLLAQVVEARISRKSAEYSEKYPPGTKEREAAYQQSKMREAPRSIFMLADQLEEENCPACESKAWLLGTEWDQSIVESGTDIHPDYGYSMPWDKILTEYNVEGFRCFECGLVLEGKDEIKFAGLSESFERVEIQEPDYEPDYGND